MGKSLSKTQKKTDTNISKALTSVCENSLEAIPGFEWLTHTADYKNFPASLIVTCVFSTDDQVNTVTSNETLAQIRKQIYTALFSIGVRFNALDQQVLLDSEERCQAEDSGAWDERLARRSRRSVSGKRRPK